jgi:hypothetical protein
MPVFQVRESVAGLVVDKKQQHRDAAENPIALLRQFGEFRHYQHYLLRAG